MSRFRKKINGMSVWKKILMIGTLFAVFGIITGARYEELIVTHLKVKEIRQLDSQTQMKISGSAGVWLSGATRTLPYVKVDMELRGDAGNTSYTIPTTYDTCFIDTHESYAGGVGITTGVSVYLPPGNADLDGFILELVNDTSDSGTTDVCLIPANDAVRGSGVTDHLYVPYGDYGYTSGGGAMSGVTYATGSVNAFLINVLDAKGENLRLMYDYDSSMSGGTWTYVSGVTKT